MNRCGIRKVWWAAAGAPARVGPRRACADGTSLRVLRGVALGRDARGKELAGLTERQQVARLEAILVDAGMVGRPTLEKCKAIKAQRELAQELADIDTSRIVAGKRQRRPAPSSTTATHHDDGDDDDDDDDADKRSALTDQDENAPPTPPPLLAGAAGAAGAVARKRLMRRRVPVAASSSESD